MAIIKDGQVLAKIWRNWSNHILLVGMQNGAATLDYTLIVPPKIKLRGTLWFSNSTLRFTQNLVHEWKFTVALFLAGKNGSNPNDYQLISVAYWNVV